MVKIAGSFPCLAQREPSRLSHSCGFWYPLAPRLSGGGVWDVSSVFGVRLRGYGDITGVLFVVELTMFLFSTQWENKLETLCYRIIDETAGIIAVLGQ